MKRHILTTALLAALGLTTANAGDNLTLVVGTYTEQSTSNGIYAYRFNQQSGQATLLNSAEADNPSFLTIDKKATRIYAVSEYNDGKQGCYAFAFNSKSGAMQRLSRQQCGANEYDKALSVSLKESNGSRGAGPCNVMICNGHVVTSNYTGGDISVFPIASDGALQPEQQCINMHTGTVGTPSHIHCCRTTPDKRYMLASDLGNDCLWRFETSGNGGDMSADLLKGTPAVAYKAEHGAGPRHFIFNRKGNRIYLINELNGTLVVLSYDNGTLKELQRVQASPTRTAGSADIHLSPDGKFLYASHRLKNDGVSIFSVDKQSGLLTKVGYQLTGAHPRNFNITPNGKFLLVACRDTNAIEVYRRDAKTGLLTDTKQGIKLGKPVCLQFVKQE